MRKALLLLFLAAPVAGEMKMGYVGRSPSLAAYFQRATSHYFEIADNAALSTGDVDFTFAVWLRPDYLSGDLRIARKGLTSGTLEWTMYYRVANTRFTFGISNDGANLSVLSGAQGPTYTVPGSWVFLVGWFDSVNNTINCQMNNTTVNSAATGTNAPVDRAGAVFLGRTDFGVSVDGPMQHAAFWKRVLTAQERTFLYNGGLGRDLSEFGAAGSAGSDLLTSLSAYWRLDEDSTGAAAVQRRDAFGVNHLTDVRNATSMPGLVRGPRRGNFRLTK